MIITRALYLRVPLAGALFALSVPMLAQTPPPGGTAPASSTPAAQASRPAPSTAAGPAVAPARTRPRPEPRSGQVAEEPLRCWWKTDRTAISVGERFTVVLTCAAIETRATTVVPNVSQLEGGAVQLTPFEVVSSTRRADIVTAPWRYLQFEYGVRLLNDGFFGQDVSIPALSVTYNFRTADGANTGRDQTYVLPALPMRVLSLVPRAAADIRDTSAMTFGDIEAARFRSTVARLMSWGALAFAAVFAALAVVRVSQRVRKKTPGAVRTASDFAQLGASAAALRAVRQDVAAAGGWSTDLARRALPALRIASASALGRPVAQQKIDRYTELREGQVLLRTGWLRRERTVLSASTTPSQIAAAADRRDLGGRARAALTGLRAALDSFSSVAYARGGDEIDRAELDSALAQGLDAVRRLRVGAFWPVRVATMAARSIFSA